MFTPCMTETPGKYNWRKVTCCPEHGAEYLKLVLDSRNPPMISQEKDSGKLKIKTEYIKEK